MESNIELKTNGRNLIVKINGDIDHHTSSRIKEKIEREFMFSNCSNIVFDFSNVNFMDSSGIGMIIGRYKSLQKNGGKIFITNVKPQLETIIEISGLRKIINFCDDIKHIIKS